MALSKIQVSSMADNTIHGRRNVIINGQFSCFQRGTSFTGVANTAYHADRFQLYMQNEASQYTVTQASDAPSGFANSLKLDVTTADTSIASNEEVKLMHKLEGQDLQQFKKGTSDAEKMTLSFYVKTNKTGVYVVELYDRDNNRDVSASYTVADANWNRYTITFPSDTSGAFGDDNASSLEISFWLVAGSAVQGGTLNTAWRSTADGSSATGQVNFSDSTDNNWQITGIQLEVGSLSPFEHRSFGEELALCQRYLQTLRGGLQGWCTNSNGNCLWTYPLHPTMRSAPTITATSTSYRFGDASTLGVNMTNISISANDYSSKECVAWLVSGTKSGTPTQFRNQILEPSSAGFATFLFTSEL